MNEQSRKRRWAPRVRTGCYTCRQRRIKCDEHKPFCNRCTRSGRRCEQRLFTSRALLATTLTERVLTSTLGQPGHAVTTFAPAPAEPEMRMFAALCHAVLPRMQGQFCRGFWHIVIPRASRVYPAVWHAALAVAAIQLRRPPNRDPAALDENDDETSDRFALQQCNKAIKCMVDVQDGVRRPAAEQEMLLITCLLLTRFSSLKGRASDAIIHIQNGIALLKQWRYGIEGGDDVLASHKCQPGCVSPAGPIVHQFMRLENQLLCSVEPDPSTSVSSLCDIYQHFSGSYLPCSEAAFAQIVAILNIHQHLRVSQQTSQPQTYSHTAIMQPPPLPSQRHLFLAWRDAFRDLQRRSSIASANIVPLPNTDILVLQAWELCGAILYALLRAVTPASTSNSGWAPHTAKLRRIVDIAEQVLPYDSNRIAVLGELLQMVVLFCTDGLVTSRALALLRSHPYRDGIFDSSAAVRRAS
ncbi:hypothetical protein PWT90_07801 [Aphanocladium album]|nr:hypothetical protein PWT90_07801 [Aphanocladium album]